jgi:hypothetical protein
MSITANIVGLAYYLLFCSCLYKIFQKCNINNEWLAFIPIVNGYLVCVRVCKFSVKYFIIQTVCLVAMLIMIPCIIFSILHHKSNGDEVRHVGIWICILAIMGCISIVMGIAVWIELGKAFGHGCCFGFWLCCIFNLIGMMTIAFSDDQYKYNNQPLLNGINGIGSMQNIAIINS